MFFLLLLLLPGVRTQDPAVPNYSPRPHQLPFNAVQFMQPKQVKNGPILFPNDAPPPPPTPLIVTSRPLSESIARSELNPNNSQAAQSQYHQVAYRPNYLARGKNYEPYSYTLATVAPVYDYESKIDYSDTATIGRKENFYKDYEKQLMDFIYPKKQGSENAELKSVQPIQHRRSDKPKQGDTKTILDIEDKNKVSETPLNNRKTYLNANGSSYYEESFNDEDNNFEFDFKKLTNNLERNSSEYLDYYPDSKQIKRRQFGILINKTDFEIRPLESLHKDSNGNAWHRLSDKEKTALNSAEEIEEIISLPPRRNIMRYVNRTNDLHLRKNDKNSETGGRTLKPLYERHMPQLRVVKPLYEFKNVQRQQNTASKAPVYKYKESPEQFYHNKNNEDERDYNNENNHDDNYAFSYTVKDHKTGDDFSHSQKSTGSATNGEYRVRLPDGRMQIVSYTADENGYKANVRYDEQHHQDNSIDFENNKDKEFLNNNIQPTYKYKAHNDHVVNQDSFENEDYLRRPLKPVPTTYKTPINYDNQQFDNINDYGNKNDNFQLYNVYPTKSVYAVTTGANNINDRTLDGLSDTNNDYLEHYNSRLEDNDKTERGKADYKFSDEVMDYSSELDQEYQPYKSKFSSFANNQNVQAQSQVRPSYDELKDLFVTNVNGRRNAAITPFPVVSTARPVYAVTPENIVAITPKKPIHNLYTNIKNIVSSTSAPLFFTTPSPSTPRGYLFSTIANLKHQISLANKPVLSDHYINKINKYLSYSNPTKITK